MSLFFYLWSRTAASNATADSAVNWSEGQSPSSVNDSARAMMASTAAFRDDISGNLQTAGTSTAYTLTSNQIFDTEAHMNGQTLTFVMSVTNGASPTLNVDGLGARPIMLDGTNAVPTGCLIAGSVYQATFYSAATAWRLRDFYVKPYEMPVGAGMDYWGSTVPNSSFAFANGAAISRVTYATLFAIFGTTYGSGDGSTTFNLPDTTGRVVATKEASATRLTSTYFGGNSTVLGATGGLESHTLTTPEIPSHTHVNTLTDPGHVHTQAGGTFFLVSAPNNATFGPGSSGALVSSTPSATTGVTITNAAAGGGGAHAIVQPTIICNYIIRVI